MTRWVVVALVVLWSVPAVGQELRISDYVQDLPPGRAGTDHHCGSGKFFNAQTGRCEHSGLVSASCGERTWSPPRYRFEDIRRSHYLDQRDVGHAFRGLGSPGHRFEIEATFRGFAYGRRGDLGSQGVAFDQGLRFDSVVAHLPGRICLTAGLDVDALGGWFDPHAGDQAEASGSRVGVRVGLLTRTTHDDTRLRIEAEGVFPSFDSQGDGAVAPRRLQAGMLAGLGRGVEDEILALSPLDWGVRAIGLLEVQFAPSLERWWGLWVNTRVSVGYARLRTFDGPREGLAGGFSVALLAGGTFPDSETSLRIGGRAGVGIGALWATDVVLPIDLVGVVEIGQSIHHDHARLRVSGDTFALEIGAILVDLPVGLGNESYFKFGLRYVHGWDW